MTNITDVLDILIAEIDEKLGIKSFYSISELKKIGWCGTRAGIHKALKRDGQIPFIKASPKRVLIPRYALIEYMRRNISMGLEDVCIKK